MLWLAVIGMWMMEGSYIPQLVRLYRKKEAEDISLWFPCMNLTGRLCVMMYSFGQGEAALAGGFLLGIVLRGTFFGQVLYYRRRKRLMDHLDAQWSAATTESSLERTKKEEKELLPASSVVSLV
jgi:hypothetical protein